MNQEQFSLLQAIRDSIHPLQGDNKNYYPLLDQIGDAHFVLLGEATHGTSEFYQARAQITSLLIKEKGFNAVAVEADFPEAYQINKFLRGMGDVQSASYALNGFKRFPVWMWNNREMLSFIESVKIINSTRAPEQHVGFYGLDLYSMYTSIEAVISYLDRVDPEAAEQARKRYSCFYQYGKDDDAYGQAMSYVKENCQQEVVSQLIEMQNKWNQYQSIEGLSEKEELFFAEQNAKLAKNAEQYYREMFNKRVKTWNLRDLFMADMVDSVYQHVSKMAGSAKVVVWAHNSHTGNALATEFSETGELSLGQLVLFRHWGDSYLVGFTTYSGIVAAASQWGGPVESMIVKPALENSYESIFHNTDIKAFMLDLNNISGSLEIFKRNHLERAIGAVYAPETERATHYFNARLADQFNAVIHFDNTNAVHY